jgi:hypothetical protein
LKFVVLNWQTVPTMRKSNRWALLTCALVIVLSSGARANELTEWDLKFLSKKVGVGAVNFAVLELTSQEMICLHFLINRFGPEEKIIADVTRFLNDVAANKLIDRKASTECPH